MFKLLDNACTNQVFIFSEIEFACNTVYAAGDNVDVLTDRIVMQHVASEMRFREADALHIVMWINLFGTIRFVYQRTKC